MTIRPTRSQKSSSPARISRDDDDDDDDDVAVRPSVGKSQPLLYLLDPRLRRQMFRWATTGANEKAAHKDPQRATD